MMKSTNKSTFFVRACKTMWRYNGRLSKNIKSHVDETTEKNGGGNIMKREDLEKLGLNNDQIEEVMKSKSSAINDNTNELNTLKQKVTELTTENQNLTKQINSANEEINSYKDIALWDTKQYISLRIPLTIKLFKMRCLSMLKQRAILTN